jgi:23S rRNA pseudouridine2605 synthase
MPLERLHKILSRAGVASRRACEEIMQAGRVSVDGQPVTELGAKADAQAQDIRLDGQRLHFERLEYWLFNKPAGVVCTNYDPAGRRMPIDYIKQSRARLFPVGRLDADSRGALLMTNDGDFAQRMVHPRFEVPKTYLATVNGQVMKQEVMRLVHGVHLAEGRTRPAEVNLLKSDRHRSLVEITIREGRNRQVRRMLARLGHEVRELVRVKIGRLTLRGLGVGHARPLSPEEVKDLLRLTETPPPERPVLVKRPWRGARREGGESRPPRREFSGPRREGGEGRPPRREFSGPRREGDKSRPPRREFSGPRREGDKSRPPRREFSGPRREGDKGRPPRREFSGPRREGDKSRSPRREFDKRPPRQGGGIPPLPRRAHGAGSEPAHPLGARPPADERSSQAKPPRREDHGPRKPFREDKRRGGRPGEEKRSQFRHDADGTRKAGEGYRGDARRGPSGKRGRRDGPPQRGRRPGGHPRK